MSDPVIATAVAAAAETTLRRIKIDPRKLKFHRSRDEPTDPGARTALDERRKTLARSWLEQPIHDVIVRDGDYAIGDGNERVAGVLLLDVAEISISLLPASTTDAELDEISLLTDFHKTSLKPVERAKVAIRMRQSTGLAPKALAERLKVNLSYLGKLMSFDDCIESVRKVAEAGRIGVEDWYLLSGKPDQQAVLDDLLSGKIKGRAGLAAAGKPAKTSASNRTKKSPVVEIPLPVDAAKPKENGSVTITGMPGGTLDWDAVEAILKRARGQAKLARAKPLSLETAQSVWAELAVAKAEGAEKTDFKAKEVPNGAP